MATVQLQPLELEYSPQPGDIALIYGPDWSSTALIGAQRAIGKRARFSHVLLNIGGSLWCQAMPRAGVEIVTAKSAFNDAQNKPRVVEVLRPPPANGYSVEQEQLDRFSDGGRVARAFAEIEVTLDANKRWLASAMYFVGQRYNFGFLLPKLFNDEGKFCSELVASIMKERGVRPFSSRYAWSFAPADLQLETSLGKFGWTDFTEPFSRYLTSEILFPPEVEQELERERVSAWFVALAEANIFRYRAMRQRIQIAILGLKFVAGPETGEALKAALVDAETLLEKYRAFRDMQSGAPWISGREGIKQLHAETKALRKAISEGTRAIQTSR